ATVLSTTLFRSARRRPLAGCGERGRAGAHGARLHRGGPDAASHSVISGGGAAPLGPSVPARCASLPACICAPTIRTALRRAVPSCACRRRETSAVTHLQ